MAPEKPGEPDSGKVCDPLICIHAKQIFVFNHWPHLLEAWSMLFTQKNVIQSCTHFTGWPIRHILNHSC